MSPLGHYEMDVGQDFIHCLASINLPNEGPHGILDSLLSELSQTLCPTALEGSKVFSFPRYILILITGFRFFWGNMRGYFHIFAVKLLDSSSRGPDLFLRQWLWPWDSAFSLRIDLDLENGWVLVIFCHGGWHQFLLARFQLLARLCRLNKTIISCPSILLLWSISNHHRSLWTKAFWLSLLPCCPLP